MTKVNNYTLNVNNNNILTWDLIKTNQNCKIKINKK